MCQTLRSLPSALQLPGCQGRGTTGPRAVQGASPRPAWPPCPHQCGTDNPLPPVAAHTPGTGACRRDGAGGKSPLVAEGVGCVPGRPARRSAAALETAWDAGAGREPHRPSNGGEAPLTAPEPARQGGRPTNQPVTRCNCVRLSAARALITPVIILRSPRV